MDVVSRQSNAFVSALSGVLAGARKAAGISQTELAARAGLSQPYIGYLEQGKHCPTAESLKRIALALGTTATDLVQAAEKISDKGGLHG